MNIDKNLNPLIKELSLLPLKEKVDALNFIREKLHEISPFQNEPVDFVKWVLNDLVHANDYNPNTVAAPEMELLKVSIESDGYTQPIVSMIDENNLYEVIDGFHRHRVGKESKSITKKLNGYLPLVQIRSTQTDKTDRMASTIRHNRARGKHKVEAMSDIVIELKRRNWSDEKISKNLGMDKDEILRLCQITGLEDVFKDQSFTEAWEAEKVNNVNKEILSDVIDGLEFDDNGRIFHTWDKWECYKNGFFAERCPNGISQETGEIMFADFLKDNKRFEKSLKIIIKEWKYSTEHNLTNDRMNRIAWLCQAAVCQSINIPAICRGGYALLNKEESIIADKLAHKYLNLWLKNNNYDEITIEQAYGRTEAELY